MPEHHSHFWEGAIFGALMGTIIGLMYAPQKGEETRKVVKDKWDELRGSLEGAKETTEEIIKNTKASIETALEDLSETIEKKKKKLNSEG